VRLVVSKLLPPLLRRDLSSPIWIKGALAPPSMFARHRRQSDSDSRFTAGASGSLNLSQSGDLPNL
jgi:hypothetical protein